jgi:ABC-type sugar transport system substrate-binding protein
LPDYKEVKKMKRLLATLSVLAALAVSAVVAVPASAGSISYDGVTLGCVQTNAGAKYTLTYKTHEFSYTVPGAKCLI